MEDRGQRRARPRADVGGGAGDGPGGGDPAEEGGDDVARRPGRAARRRGRACGRSCRRPPPRTAATRSRPAWRWRRRTGRGRGPARRTAGGAAPSGPGIRHGRSGSGGSGGMPGWRTPSITYWKRLPMVATSKPGMSRLSRAAAAPAISRATSAAGTFCGDLAPGEQHGQRQDADQEVGELRAWAARAARTTTLVRRSAPASRGPSGRAGP